MIRKLTISLSFLFLVILIPKITSAQKFTEYEVKAGYIYNFARFVEWPKDSFANETSPIVIGIYGNDRFGEIIRRTIRNSSIEGRSFVIKYYNQPSQIQQCHILFVSELTKTETMNLLKVVKKKSILTVGDNIQGFCQMGGIINFTPQYDRHRFEINNITAKNNDLIISSKLLTLAKIVTINEIEF
ncbi:MAG: YfiR family protein [Salinivirgaceae bacterium]|nr:YfiR family protein [Salinivirgaceae bacterium]MDD4746766.1 YfiR family protein [Salinivirgaceae bacterium]MDY0280624.1 YfiR family protein [Salinivirgaceae bacterium]